MGKAKPFPFSLSKEDEAYEILSSVTGNRSEWLRKAVLFYNRYQGQEIEIERAMAVYRAVGDESIGPRIERIISEKLDKVAEQLAARGIVATEEINQAKASVDMMDDLLSKFDEAI